MKTKGNGFWIVMSLISFFIALCTVVFGIEKMQNYSNGEYYPYEYHNYYVGGDAYNYIINASYANGYFILAAIFSLLGIGFIVVYYQTMLVSSQKAILSSCLSMERGIYKLCNLVEDDDTNNCPTE